MEHIVLKDKPARDLVEKWHRCLEGSDYATQYVSPAFFDDPYVSGERFAVLAMSDDGDVEAVASGVLTRGSVTCGLFSRPQTVFSSKANRVGAAAAIVEGVKKLSDGQPVVNDIYTWESANEFEALGLSVRSSSEATSVVMLDLKQGPDAIFSKFSQTRRNEIRKAVKADAVVIKELETESELEQLYEIHCKWNALKGNKPDTYERMETAARQLDTRRIFIAVVGETVVAGSFYRFFPGGVVEYAANFSKPEFQKLRPNDLIGWHAIQWACEHSFSHFSMGGSHLFLRRFGGEILTTYRYRQDGSLLKLTSLKESSREMGGRVYRRLPESLRAGIKKMVAG